MTEAFDFGFWNADCGLKKQSAESMAHSVKTGDRGQKAEDRGRKKYIHCFWLSLSGVSPAGGLAGGQYDRN